MIFNCEKVKSQLQNCHPVKSQGSCHLDTAKLEGI